MLPIRNKGRQTKEAQDRYEEEVRLFCDSIRQIGGNWSSRGWCYLLEGKRIINKDEFDAAQRLINNCRKDGSLPVNICADDEARSFGCLEGIIDDDETAEEHAEGDVDCFLSSSFDDYTPFSFWEDKEYYCQMLVEKIDLRTVFEPICKKFNIPIANAKGWPDINMRAHMMERYAAWEGKGKTPVLFYCGDHDPAGLHISESYKNMFYDLADAVGWTPSDLIIDRFGLNYDFIMDNNLTWIDNLLTGDGKDLADTRHKDHYQPYVQDYLKQFGVRKVEANALLIVKEAAKALCLNAILKYLPAGSDKDYSQKIWNCRQDVSNQVLSILKERLYAD